MQKELAYHSERLFKPELASQGSINIVKVLSFSFEKCFSPFAMLLVKGSLKRDFLDIYLTTYFCVRKFRNTSGMRVIFFLKIFKIEPTFRKCKNKIDKNFFNSEIIATENVVINCFC